MADEKVFIPIVPSFDGFFTAIGANSKKAGKQAGDDFADAMASAISAAESKVERATSGVERARKRAADAADKTRLAETKLAEVLEKGDAKASQIQKATNDLNKARRDQESADKAAEKAAGKLAQAQDDLAARTREADDAVEVNAKSLELWGDQAGAAGGALKDLAGKAGALAGIGGVGAFLAEGLDLSNEIGRMERQLGMVGDSAGLLTDDVKQALSTGVAASATDAADAVGALTSQFSHLGLEGEQSAGALADNVMAISDTFGTDMAEVTQTVGQLVQNGLATDVENGADLMTAALQRVPAAMRDELPEIINEYGVNFAGLGYSGEEAFSMLVAASEKGKFALDKTGDALKEFQIRGSDMSASSVEAFESIGLNAEEMASKIAAGGPGAREALEETARGILAIEDPAARANTAIALFGTPLEDMSVDQIPQFLDALAGGQNHMENFAGSSQALADAMADSFDGRMNRVKGALQSLAVDTFMALYDSIEKVVVFCRDNADWIGPIAAGIGGAAAAWGMWTGAIMLWKGATTIATGVQAAFNAVMSANPIMLVTMAIAGLVAGLTYFFTQTETGKAMWESFTTFLGDSWDWLVGVFTTGWDWIKTNIIDAFVNGWNDAMSNVSERWSEIGEKWSALKDWFAETWEAIRTGVIDAWNWYWGQVGENFQNAIGFIVDGWNRVTDGIAAGWDFIRGAVLDAWEWYWGRASANIQLMADVAVGAWNWLGDALAATWGFIRDAVLGALMAYVDNVRNNWRAAVDMMAGAWDWLRDKVGGAVEGIKNFLGDLVGRFWSIGGSIRDAFANAGSWLLDAGRAIISGLAEGIRSAAGWIADAIRAVVPDSLEQFVPGLHFGGLIPAFARGGVLPRVPGISDSQRDPILGLNGQGVPIARVEPGEFIVNREATRANIRLLTMINAGALTGFHSGGMVPGLAVGGVAPTSGGIRVDESVYRDLGGVMGEEFAAVFIDVVNNEDGLLAKWSGAVTDIHAYLSTMSPDQAMSLMDEVGSIAGLGKVSDTIGGVVNGMVDLEAASQAQQAAAAQQAEAEQRLMDARNSMDVEGMLEATNDMNAAMEAASAASVGMGQAQIGMILEIAKLVVGVIEKINGRISAMRIGVTNAMAGVMGNVSQLTSLIDEQRQHLAAMHIEFMSQRSAQAKAAFDLRLANIDVARAQLTGVRNVAEAEAAMAAERERIAGQSIYDFADMSLAYDRYRQGLRDGTDEQLDAINVLRTMDAQRVADQYALADEERAILADIFAGKFVGYDIERASLDDQMEYAQAYRVAQKVGMHGLLEQATKVTPELLALNHEVNAARLASAVAEQTAAMAAVEAQHKSAEAAFSVLETQRAIAKASAQLARMTGETFGLSQPESMVAEEIAKKYAEIAKLQGERDNIGSVMRANLGALWSGFTGQENAWTEEYDGYNDAIRALKSEINSLMNSEYAPRYSGSQLDEIRAITERAGKQYAAGRTAAGDAIIQGSFLGDAGRAVDRIKLDSELAKWQDTIDQLSSDKAKAQRAYDFDSKMLEMNAALEALKSGQSAEEGMAAALRESNAAVAKATQTLAEFEMRMARETVSTTRGGGGEFTINYRIADKAAYSAEEVRELLLAANQVPGLTARVEALEAPEKVGSGALINNRRY